MRWGLVQASLVCCAIFGAIAPAAHAVPPNDSFASATVVGAVPYADAVNTFGATMEAGEPQTCSPASNSVWYRFTPSSAVRAHMDSTGAVYTSLLDVFTGSTLGLLTKLTPQGCPDWFNGTFAAGVTYYVRIVDHSHVNLGGNLPFEIRPFGAPTNDAIADAKSIPSLPYSDYVDATTATAIGEPSGCSTAGWNSVWYRLTVAKRQRLLIDNEKGDTAWSSVFSGSPGSLHLESCKETDDSRDFIADAGKQYYVKVEGFGEPDRAISITKAMIEPELQVFLSKTKALYGTTIKVRAHLSESDLGMDNKIVSIYRKPRPTGTRTLLASGPVDADGNFIVSIKAARLERFDAEYTGDAQYAPATSFARELEVRAKTLVTLSGGRKKGRERVYPKGAEPIVNVSVLPNHAGQKVQLRFSVFVPGGGWNDLDSARFRLRANGKVRIRIVRPAPGYLFRVRAWFGGDKDHLYSLSAPVFFRVAK